MKHPRLGPRSPCPGLRLRFPSARVTRATWLVVSLSTIGCGSKDAAATTQAEMKARVCEPGTVYSCSRGGCNGRQSCRSDGSGLQLCVCDTADSAGTGGSGRDAGSQPDAAARDAASAAQDASRREDASESSDAAPAEPERCDNGEDDDGDGKLDCADEDCAAMRCIEAAPSGWQGPVAFRTAAAPITCAGGFDQRAFEAGAEPEAEPASCSPCSCRGVCSEFADFRTSATAQCGGAGCSTSVSASCIEISPQCLQGAATAYLQTALPSASACSASEQRPTLSETRWKTHAAACKPGGAERGGCTAEQLCLPREPGGGFEAGYCIWREGDVACPAAGYSQRRIYHREISDTRACSACSCGASDCGYTWRVFNADDMTCTAPVLELSSVEQCAQVNPVMGKLRVGFAKTGTGACTPAGGEPRGGVTATSPLTVCCSR